MLLFQLPREASFMQATLGDRVRWGPSEYLMAHIADGVSLVVNALQNRWRRKGQPAVKWRPLPRPGDRPDEDKVVLGRGKGMTVAEMRRRLDQRRAGEG